MAATKTMQETAVVDLGSMLDAGDGALVTLVAGDTRLVAHRAVLADRSPVFAAMFRHETLESSSSQVEIPDVEGPVLRQLLAYLYSLRAPLLASMAAQLLVAADKYGVSRLKAECEQHLTAQLAEENAAAAAVLAIRHSCHSLAMAALAFIKAHPQVFSTQGWADAVLKQPRDAAQVRRMLSEPPAQTRCLSQEEKDRRLIEAAKQGAVEELSVLLVAGADVAARDEEQNTALHWSADRGHVQATRLLLAVGADLEARCSCNEDTPLHWAAGSGQADVVRLLLAASADPNVRSSTGWTPLHCAAWRGHTEVVTALLQAGADRRAESVIGDTPLQIARTNRCPHLVDMLQWS